VGNADASSGAQEHRAATLGRWRPAPGVLSCVHGDTTTLLALRGGRRGRYLTLNEVGSLVWHHLLREPDASLIPRRVAEHYGIPDAIATVRQDVEALLLDLRRRRLLRPASVDSDMPAPIETKAPSSYYDAPAPAASPTPTPTPSLIFAFAVLVLVSLALRVFGLRRVLRHLYRVRSCAGTPLQDLQETVAVIEQAAPLVPWRAQCLEQSLCLLAFARRAGVSAYLRIGVLPFPFEAHAWVEHRGEAINDTQEQLQIYRAFPPLDMEALT
jgi:Transglutaminase-like superfamily/Coenzyme PQQ synthesis protein D (PqqD)